LDGGLALVSVARLHATSALERLGSLREEVGVIALNLWANLELRVKLSWDPAVLVHILKVMEYLLGRLWQGIVRAVVVVGLQHEVVARASVCGVAIVVRALQELHGSGNEHHVEVGAADADAGLSRLAGALGVSMVVTLVIIVIIVVVMVVMVIVVVMVVVLVSVLVIVMVVAMVVFFGSLRLLFVLSQGGWDQEG
jgi:hypothetical protein